VQPPKAWAESIRAWQPDVVLYPEIGMDLATAYLASLRLAETQVAMWGHPHTTGLPTIDYFLSADALEPSDAEQHYTERLIRLPRLGCCFAPAQVAPTAVDLDALGIKQERPLLLSPGMPQKYMPQHDWVFPEIAHRLGPCSIAFFSDDEIRPLTDVLFARLAAAFAARGMAFSDYCVVLPWLQRGPYFGLMRRAEVMLDTIGFSGFNTAMQAVECGLPIVTQEGRFMRGRFASGILRSIGLDELVAADAQQYVDLAVAVATDKDRRASLRRRMAERRGPLFNDREVVSALQTWLLELVGK
jgi:predicted O-linked N-acetylglucosamine transferase (SPINDLY family)